MKTAWNTTIVAVALFITTGCGGAKTGDDPSPAKETGSGAKPSKTDSKSDDANPKTDRDVVRKPSKRRKPIGGETPMPGSNNNGANRNASAKSESAKAMLSKLQILVGTWRGLPRKAVDVVSVEPKWAWDFSKNGEPALAFQTKDGPYLRKGRLTYRTNDAEYPFRLETVGKDGKKKTYRGKFTKEITDTPAGGKIVNRSFKITFTQIDPKPTKREDLYQIDLEQQENNRYLMTVHNRRGTRLRQLNVVANRRQGTSFAMKLDDYGDKTCVVSQGLGTMAVSYMGRTFYVCCSGCKAAFEEDPKKWIASFEKWKEEQKK